MNHFSYSLIKRSLTHLGFHLAPIGSQPQSNSCLVVPGTCKHNHGHHSLGPRQRNSWLVQNPYNTLFRNLNEGEGTPATASFIPAVDLFPRTTKKVVLKLEVPGIEEKDLDVSVEKKTLTIKGGKAQA